MQRQFLWHFPSPSLLFFVFTLLVQVRHHPLLGGGGVFGYEVKDVSASQSCSASYLYSHVTSAPHLARLLQVFDWKYFNQPCGPPGNTNLWDGIRPKPKLVIFIHMGLSPRSAVVMSEVLVALGMSRLLHESWEVRVGVSGNGILPFLPGKLKVVASDEAATTEFATFSALLHYIHNETRTKLEVGTTLVCYLHTKGSFNVQRGSEDWRRFMLFFNVWLFRWAVILLQHYQSYGVNLNPTHPAMFDGNFWWARLSLLRRLDPTLLSRDSWLLDRNAGQRWIGHSVYTLNDTDHPSNTRMICLLTSGYGGQHYHYLFPPALYTNWKSYVAGANFVYAHRPGFPPSFTEALIPRPMQCLRNYVKECGAPPASWKRIAGSAGKQALVQSKRNSIRRWKRLHKANFTSGR